MTESLPEYILAGKASELSSWTEYAAVVGILWCFEHERAGGDLCSTSCVRPAFCAIREKSVTLRVIPAQSVSTFGGSEFEWKLAIIPSKKLGIGDIDSVRLLVSRLVYAFQGSDVVCFESIKTPGGEIEWRSFAGTGTGK